MNDERQQDLFDPEGRSREGAFDAQLALPLPSMEMPQPFGAIRKRDGREEPFDKRKIADAIFKAAQTVGGQDYDLAQSLASAVTIYLTKRLRDKPPTVDQVHDAVERVLIMMSHAKTALAYARYRDRRARIRRLREGDMRLLLSELEEARDERESLAGAKDRALVVRTSEDALAVWNREKIVEALMRETGLDRALALMVAIEVEQQLQAARIHTLTSSLVRELVDAKLIEHGLDEFRENHRRLGVPLYDATRLLRGVTPETIGRDPVATDRALAQAVKKEYALAQVFSAPVAEAHLRGELHLHHLDRVDRLFAAEHDPALLVQQGLRLPNGDRFAEAPKHADTLLAQLLKLDEIHRAYMAEAPVWGAVNLHFAPFLEGWEGRDIERFAQMLVYEFAYRSLAHGEQVSPTELGLVWRTPAHLRTVEAWGPGGSTTGKPYSAYEAVAQQLAWAIVEVVRKGGADGAAFPGPLLRAHIDAGFFAAPGQEAFLALLGEAIVLRRPIEFLFEREPRAATSPGHVEDVVLQQVTLNLPRAAYVTGKESALLMELSRLLDIAAMAHQEKRDFIEGLMDAGSERPLAWLSTDFGEGPYVDLDTAQCVVAVDGLHECVRILLNAETHRQNEAAALAERILAYIDGWRQQQSERRGLHFVSAQNNDFEVSRRFATLDVRDFPRTAVAALPGDQAVDLRYTQGVRLTAGHGLNPVEAARMEGGFHTWIGYGARTEIALPAESLSAETVADFVKKIWRQSANRRIVFV
jgi:ribonucleoside-triphosphate reductase